MFLDATLSFDDNFYFSQSVNYFCLFGRYLTPEGVDECTENGKSSADDIIRVALDVSLIFYIHIKKP